MAFGIDNQDYMVIIDSYGVEHRIDKATKNNFANLITSMSRLEIHMEE